MALGKYRMFETKIDGKEKALTTNKIITNGAPRKPQKTPRLKQNQKMVETLYQFFSRPSSLLSAANDVAIGQVKIKDSKYLMFILCF